MYKIKITRRVEKRTFVREFVAKDIEYESIVQAPQNGQLSGTFLVKNQLHSYVEFNGEITSFLDKTGEVNFYILPRNAIAIEAYDMTDTLVASIKRPKDLT